MFPPSPGSVRGGPTPYVPYRGCKQLLVSRCPPPTGSGLGSRIRKPSLGYIRNPSIFFIIVKTGKLVVGLGGGGLAIVVSINKRTIDFFVLENQLKNRSQQKNQTLIRNFSSV